jgi:hypothetical protein
VSREPIRERGMQPALCRPEPPTPVSVLPSTPPPGPELPHVYGVLEQTAEKLGAAKARISTLEALTDQLAEALRFAHPVGGRYDKGGSCLSCAALCAYEAGKEAHR